MNFSSYEVEILIKKVENNCGKYFLERPITISSFCSIIVPINKVAFIIFAPIFSVITVKL